MKREIIESTISILHQFPNEKCAINLENVGGLTQQYIYLLMYIPGCVCYFYVIDSDENQFS